MSGWLSFQLHGIPSVLKRKFLCLDIKLKEKKAGGRKRREEGEVLVQLVGDYGSTVTKGTYMGALKLCGFINKPEGLLLRCHPLPRVSRSACLIPSDSRADTTLIPASLGLMN